MKALRADHLLPATGRDVKVPVAIALTLIAAGLICLWAAHLNRKGNA